MDARSRAQLTQMLVRQMLASTDKALRKARAWEERNAAIKRGFTHPDGADARIMLKNDLDLKDLMSAYTWHRDHAQFCATLLQTLELPDVRPLTGAPAYVGELVS